VLQGEASDKKVLLDTLRNLTPADAAFFVDEFREKDSAYVAQKDRSRFLSARLEANGIIERQSLNLSRGQRVA
jgi:hypothetical protein